MEELTVMGIEELEMENTPIDELESEIVNLIFVGIDCSSSMLLYENDMRDCLNNFKDALSNSKEADELLVARANFQNNDIQIGGYKKIEEFDTNYSTRGMTPLFDTIKEGSEKLIKYMDLLRSNGMRVKAVFAIFSDGDDTSSSCNVADAIKSIKDLNQREIVTAFISFGQDAFNIGGRLKFKNTLEVNSSVSELRKAFNCLSKSIIENSKSVISKTDDFFV